jgi:hypothetical protein
MIRWEQRRKRDAPPIQFSPYLMFIVPAADLPGFPVANFEVTGSKPLYLPLWIPDKRADIGTSAPV